MLKLPALPPGCPLSLALIACNVLLYAGQVLTQEQLTRLGLLYGPAIQQGDTWRLLSSGFLHGSLLHIGFNMYLLYMLGPQLENAFGTLRFALMYFGSLFGGALAVMLFDWQQPTLGASAAVLGLAGAMAMLLHQRGISPRQSPVFGLVILNLALPLLVPGISFWGHFGGVFAGALIAGLLLWLPASHRSVSTGSAISLGAAAVVLLAAGSYIVAIQGGIL